jgi:hypothetical protein
MTYRDTSRAAYATATVGENEARVLAYVKHSSGMTCDEFIAATGMPHQSASPAFTSLEQRGLLLRTSDRRPTRTGSMAAVYVAVEPDSLFSRPTKGRADALRDLIRAARKARETGDWGEFDAAWGGLPHRERERLQ